MDKTCVYTISNSGNYPRMLFNSLRMLRKYNSSIPVKVIAIGGTDNHLDNNLAGYDVEVITRPFLESPEGNYFPVNRVYMKELSEPSILHIDADTFIFGDVNEIFETYKNVDFAAEKARWVCGRPDWDDELTFGISPFISGVHLWNNGAIQKWDLLKNCELLREKRFQVSDYLYKINENCYNREEFSIPISLNENNLKYEYFRPQHCKAPLFPGDIDTAPQSLIFHSYAINWKRTYTQMYGKRLSPKFFG